MHLPSLIFGGDTEDTKAEKRTDRYLDLWALTENKAYFSNIKSGFMPFTALETKHILLPLGTISETETRHCGTVTPPPCPLPLHYHPMPVEDTKLMSPLPLEK